LSAETGDKETAREWVQGVILGLVDGFEPETLEEVFSEDPELAGRVIEALPGMSNARLTLLRVLSRYLRGLSADERRELLEGMLRGVDGSLAAGASNEFSQLVMEIHRDNPDLAADLSPAIEAALSGTDFGKAREAMIALLDYWTEVMSRSIEITAANPVIIANIVGMLPPLANSIIKVISVLLHNAELPPEILASALFSVLSALDAEELGRVLSALSDQVNALHAGNLILGGDEPRARAVTEEIARRVLDDLDAESLARAIVAIGEDAEVISGVLIEIVARDPKLVDLATWAAVGLTNVSARVLEGALEAAAAWPDSLLTAMGEEGRMIDTVEVGRAIDAFITYALRLRDANPGLHRALYSKGFQAVNTERVEMHARAVAGDMKAAAISHPAIRKALEPEEVGRRISEALAGLNVAAGAQATRDYLTRVFGAIDPREVEAAARNIGGGLIDAAFASADIAAPLLRAAASNAWKLIKGVFNVIVKS
jgi:hypothetical protein